jgi:hypothetical protein
VVGLVWAVLWGVVTYLFRGNRTSRSVARCQEIGGQCAEAGGAEFLGVVAVDPRPAPDTSSEAAEAGQW